MDLWKMLAVVAIVAMAPVLMAPGLPGCSECSIPLLENEYAGEYVLDSLTNGKFIQIIGWRSGGSGNVGIYADTQTGVDKSTYTHASMVPPGPSR